MNTYVWYRKTGNGFIKINEQGLVVSSSKVEAKKLVESNVGYEVTISDVPSIL